MRQFIESAKNLIDKHRSDVHKVGAVLQSNDGTLYTGVSVQGQKLHLCSEWTAITKALMDDAKITMAVAVHKNGAGEYTIFPPCALCRELYVTYFPEAKIIIDEENIIIAKELLPHAWKKE